MYRCFLKIMKVLCYGLFKTNDYLKVAFKRGPFYIVGLTQSVHSTICVNQP
jgi:hypothetical protein